MSSLHPCPDCAGLVPDRSATCPNCGAAVARRRRLGLRALVALAGTSGLAVTLMACYGSPCYDDSRCLERPDLSVPTADMATACSADDGGCVDGGAARK